MSLPPSMEELRRAREAVRTVAANSDLPEWPLTLVVTELLANAIAVTPPDEVIDLVLTCDDGEIEVRVLDSGPGLNREFLERSSTVPEPAQPRGRGLYLVGRFARGLRIDRLNGRTVITARVGDPDASETSLDRGRCSAR